MTAVLQFDEAEVMRQTYCRGDRLMAILLAIHALAALCFASFYETWLVTFVVTGLAVSMFALSWILLPATLTTLWVPESLAWGVPESLTRGAG